MNKNVLLVGESWVSSSTHFKGFDQFGSVTFHTGAKPLKAALEGSHYNLTFMPAHEAAEEFPFEKGALDQWDVIILSDIGSNSFLLPQAVWLDSKTVPNRLKIIREWVEDGGALLMAGGYLSFQGIDGKARWRKTPVEDTLPVMCQPWDDRVEIPEGAVADILLPKHDIVKDLSSPWPYVLGVNEVEVKDQDHIEVIAKLPDEHGGHPLLVVGHYGKGRTAAWTSDISPHWLSPEFCAWEGYAKLWINMFDWLTAR